MKYRKKPVVIEAHQWFKNGDHPDDDVKKLMPPADVYCEETEGKVVRYYRHPLVEAHRVCDMCGTSDAKT